LYPIPYTTVMALLVSDFLNFTHHNARSALSEGVNVLTNLQTVKELHFGDIYIFYFYYILLQTYFYIYIMFNETEYIKESL
jgi:hypothetical protein